MFSRLDPVYKGILLVLAGYTAYACADICVKKLMQHYPLYQVLMIESGGAAALLAGLSAYLGGMKGLSDPRNLKIHLMRIILNFGLTSMLTWCYRAFPIADVYTMIFTTPFFAAILAIWLYKEHATPSRWIAIAVGFCGVIIAMRPGGGHFEPLLLMPLAGAGLLALLYILPRSLREPTIFSVGFLPMFGTALLSAPLAIAGFTPVQIADVPIFVLLGCCAAMGMVGVSMAFRIAPASVVAPFLYTEMIWALIFGYYLFGDKPDLYMLAGAGVIILSGIYLVETERRNFAQ